MSTSYSLLFPKNPAADLLVTLVGIDPFDDRIADGFVRAVEREPRTKKLWEKVKVDGRNESKRGSYTFGVDEAFITLIVRDFTGKFDAKKAGFFKPVYFCCAKQDETEEEYWYINYRIPYHYRHTLSSFATWLPYQVGERVEELKRRLQDKHTSRKTDDLSDRLLEVASDLMLALAKRLQEIRADRQDEWARAYDGDNYPNDHQFGERAKVITMEGFLKDKAKKEMPSSPSRP